MNCLTMFLLSRYHYFGDARIAAILLIAAACRSAVDFMVSMYRIYYLYIATYMRNTSNAVGISLLGKVKTFNKPISAITQKQCNQTLSL